MSSFTRLSAAAVSIVVTSAFLGFELGAAAVADHGTENIDFSGAPVVASPGAGSEKNMKTRSVAGIESAFDSFGAFSSKSYPRANPLGPRAGDARVRIRLTRAIAPACLMAMN